MTYKRIRSLSRGIGVLQHLNAVGSATAAEIARDMRLPRPTVYRILDVLIDQRLIYQSPSQKSVYRVTGNVRRLSAGLMEEDWSAAAAVLAEYSNVLLWPMDLAVYEDGAMTVLESTRGSTAFSAGFGWAGRQRSVLSSALGRAFLAFAGEVDRQAFVDAHWSNSMPEEVAASLEAAMSVVKSEGYAVFEDREHSAPGELALPIRKAGVFVASLGLSWDRRIIDTSTFVARKLGDLDRVRSMLESQLVRFE